MARPLAALPLQHSERASLVADRGLERRAARAAFRRQRHRLDDDRRECDLESRRQSQGDRTDAGQRDRRRRIQACKKESRLHEAFVTRALIIVSAIRQKNERRHFSVSHFSVWLASVAEMTINAVTRLIEFYAGHFC